MLGTTEQLPQLTQPSRVTAIVKPMLELGRHEKPVSAQELLRVFVVAVVLAVKIAELGPGMKERTPRRIQLVKESV